MCTLFGLFAVHTPSTTLLSTEQEEAAYVFVHLCVEKRCGEYGRKNSYKNENIRFHLDKLLDSGRVADAQPKRRWKRL